MLRLISRAEPGKKGTIRGDFALAVGRNICHGSDSVENGEKEIKLSVFPVCRAMMVHDADYLLPLAGSPRASFNTRTHSPLGSSSR